MLRVTSLSGFGSKPPGSITYEFGASAVDTSDTDAYTFSGIALGAAGAKKVVVAVATQGGGGTPSISTLTVDGQSASLGHQITNGGDGVVELWYVDNVTAATGDVVATWDSARDRCGCGTHALVGATAGAEFDQGGGSSTPAPTDPANCPAGGAILAVVETELMSATHSWAGVTERYDEVIEATQFHSGAADAFIAEQTNLTITATLSGTASNASPMAFVSWGPA